MIRGLGLDGAGLRGDEAVAHEPDGADGAVALEQRHRRDEEADHELPRARAGGALRVALEDLDLLETGAVPALLERRPAELVQLDLLGLDHDVGGGQLAQLLDLRIGERRLRRVTTPDTTA